MPRPEPFEKLMQEAPDLEARTALIRNSFALDDMVCFYKDGIELEGTIAEINGDRITVRSRFGDFVLARKNLCYPLDAELPQT